MRLNFIGCCWPQAGGVGPHNSDLLVTLRSCAGGEDPRRDIDTPSRPIAIRVRRSTEAGIRLFDERAKFVDMRHLT